MTLPLVSIIIATHRRSNELETALNSIATQTYKNLEVVVVDDNADPKWNSDVQRIVNNFIEANSGIATLLKTNSTNYGPAKTRNIGIEASHGEYITFLDDDDQYLPNKVENQTDYMLKTNCDYCVTDLILYNRKNIVVDKRTRTYIKDNSSDSLLRYHFMYHITGTDTIMFRKKYLVDIGGFDLIDIGDEFYLIQKAILNKGVFGYLHECQIKAYVHNNNFGLSSGQKKIDGENSLYAHKQTYFNQLDLKCIRHINMRHYAVLAYTELKMRRYSRFISNAFKSLFASPFACLRLFLGIER